MPTPVRMMRDRAQLTAETTRSVAGWLSTTTSTSSAFSGICIESAGMSTSRCCTTNAMVVTPGSQFCRYEPLAILEICGSCQHQPFQASLFARMKHAANTGAASMNDLGQESWHLLQMRQLRQYMSASQY